MDFQRLFIPLITQKKLAYSLPKIEARLFTPLWVLFAALFVLFSEPWRLAEAVLTLLPWDARLASESASLITPLLTAGAFDSCCSIVIRLAVSFGILIAAF